jgi:hypothetical protein
MMPLTDLCMLNEDFCMRTTLDLRDDLLREAKKRAADQGETLTRLLERALHLYLQAGDATATDFRFEPLVKRGEALTALDWDDRDALYERMEGRA